MKTFKKLLEHLQRNMFSAGLLLCLFSISINNFAQISTASINGSVRDPSGANVSNAVVVLHNVDTSVENTTVSNSA